MKTRRLDNGLLVFDGGAMDGILVHESSDAYIKHRWNQPVKNH